MLQHKVRWVIPVALLSGAGGIAPALGELSPPTWPTLFGGGRQLI
ncbi:hypothetical protein MHM_03520 [Candidatus Mycoplasma haemominutum 'Birmingham 1']|uniref:Uncharacterized protein n=1 Tax=Candidatus Mycoplasma haematominutum 'Birmingham 1' TaxID=1116213 RepID=G8C3H2_9MOLU|nr:hypothetical protein MHM_03520 [Candidatus Mycoplasma haematominutum 'Birmingham 1']